MLACRWQGPATPGAAWALVAFVWVQARSVGSGRISQTACGDHRGRKYDDAACCEEPAAPAGQTSSPLGHTHQAAASERMPGVARGGRCAWRPPRPWWAARCGWRPAGTRGTSATAAQSWRICGRWTWPPGRGGRSSRRLGFLPPPGAQTSWLDRAADPRAPGPASWARRRGRRRRGPRPAAGGGRRPGRSQAPRPARRPPRAAPWLRRPRPPRRAAHRAGGGGSGLAATAAQHAEQRTRRCMQRARAGAGRGDAGRIALPDGRGGRRGIHPHAPQPRRRAGPGRVGPRGAQAGVSPRHGRPGHTHVAARPLRRAAPVLVCVALMAQRLPWHAVSGSPPATALDRRGELAQQATLQQLSAPALAHKACGAAFASRC